MVRFVDERPIGEIVDVWSFADEGDVHRHEYVQSSHRVVAGHRERGNGLISGALEPGSRHGGQECPLVAEVNIGRLMTDPQLLGDAPETQVLRRLIRQYSRTQDKVFPSGVYFKGGTYGSDVNFPVPDGEKVNPAFQGCMDRKA